MLLVLVLAASAAVTVSRAPAAHACSIAPPLLEVSPATDLRPGDPVKVRGLGFVEPIWHEVDPQVDPSTGEVLPSHSCAGLELVPRTVELRWIGIREEPVQRVQGPEFEVVLHVPTWAEPGWLGLSADGILADLVVAGGPPPPCPLSTDGFTEGRAWPDHCPWPCSDFDDSAVVGGPCPEPCPLAAVPGDAAGLVWLECPDPCGYAAGDAALWCPPPCLHVVDGDVVCAEAVPEPLPPIDVEPPRPLPGAAAPAVADSIDRGSADVAAVEIDLGAEPIGERSASPCD